jgi:hypothetical protein
MKKITLLVLISWILITPSLAQEENPTKESYDKNLLKINLTGLFLKNYGFQYERMLGRKTSIALGFRTQPKGELPLLGFLENRIDDPETFSELRNIGYGNTAITPEIRFYFGKKGGPSGFYIAPYARYSKSQVRLQEFEFSYEETVNGQIFEETRTIELTGDVTGITGGLMFGAQWKLGKAVYLDWWIIGGSFGNSTGLIKAATTLDQNEQEGLREELNNLDIPILDYTVRVDGNGAKMDFDGPFASLRGGLSLGIKF